jgi:hypothetical protein
MFRRFRNRILKSEVQGHGIRLSRFYQGVRSPCHPLGKKKKNNDTTGHRVCTHVSTDSARDAAGTRSKRYDNSGERDGVHARDGDDDHRRKGRCH